MKTIKIIDHLDKLSTTYAKLGDGIRSGTFARVISVIKESKIEDIESGAQVAHLHGVGSSTIKEIDEFIQTETSNRLKAITEELEKKEANDSKKEEKINNALSLLKSLRKSQ